jgi:hypothetical protein
VSPRIIQRGAAALLTQSAGSPVVNVSHSEPSAFPDVNGNMEFYAVNYPNNHMHRYEATDADMKTLTLAGDNILTGTQYPWILPHPTNGNMYMLYSGAGLTPIMGRRTLMTDKDWASSVALNGGSAILSVDADPNSIWSWMANMSCMWDPVDTNKLHMWIETWPVNHLGPNQGNPGYATDYGIGYTFATLSPDGLTLSGASANKSMIQVAPTYLHGQPVYVPERNKIFFICHHFVLDGRQDSDGYIGCDIRALIIDYAGNLGSPSAYTDAYFRLDGGVQQTSASGYMDAYGDAHLFVAPAGKTYKIGLVHIGQAGGVGTKNTIRIWYSTRTLLELFDACNKSWPVRKDPQAANIKLTEFFQNDPRLKWELPLNTSITDITGNGNNGAITGSITDQAIGDTTGKAKLTTGDSYIALSNFHGKDYLAGAHGFMFWIKRQSLTDGAGGKQLIAEDLSPSARIFAVEMDVQVDGTNKVGYFVFDSVGGNYYFTEAVRDGANAITHDLNAHLCFVGKDANGNWYLMMDGYERPFKQAGAVPSTIKNATDTVKLFRDSNADTTRSCLCVLLTAGFFAGTLTPKEFEAYWLKATGQNAPVAATGSSHSQIGGRSEVFNA